MPASATITSSDIFTFVAGTRARASEVNTMFKTLGRGHSLPVNTDTATTADNTYDLGATDAEWRNAYLANFPKVGGNDLGGFLSPGPHGLGIFAGNTTSELVIKKIDGTDLSTTNYGLVVARRSTNTSSESYTVHTIAANVTFTLSGLPFGNTIPVSGVDASADLDPGILDVIFMEENENTGFFGVAWLPGRSRTEIAPTNICSTQASCTAYEHVYSQTSGSGNPATVIPCFWFQCSLDATGGAASNIWTVKNTLASLNIGSSDGMWRDWNPVHTGFVGASVPTGEHQWTAIGGTCFFNYAPLVDGTSNNPDYTVTLPCTPKVNAYGTGGRFKDNSGFGGPTVFYAQTTGIMTLEVNFTGSNTWQSANLKSAYVTGFFEIADA